MRFFFSSGSMSAEERVYDITKLQNRLNLYKEITNVQKRLNTISKFKSSTRRGRARRVQQARLKKLIEIRNKIPRANRLGNLGGGTAGRAIRSISGPSQKNLNDAYSKVKSALGAYIRAYIKIQLDTRTTFIRKPFVEGEALKKALTAYAALLRESGAIVNTGNTASNVRGSVTNLLMNKTKAESVISLIEKRFTRAELVKKMFSGYNGANKNSAIRAVINSRANINTALTSVGFTRKNGKVVRAPVNVIKRSNTIRQILNNKYNIGNENVAQLVTRLTNATMNRALQSINVNVLDPLIRQNYNVTYVGTKRKLTKKAGPTPVPVPAAAASGPSNVNKLRQSIKNQLKSSRKQLNSFLKNFESKINTATATRLGAHVKESTQHVQQLVVLSGQNPGNTNIQAQLAAARAEAAAARQALERELASARAEANAARRNANAARAAAARNRNNVAAQRAAQEASVRAATEQAASLQAQLAAARAAGRATGELAQRAQRQALRAEFEKASLAVHLYFRNQQLVAASHELTQTRQNRNAARARAGVASRRASIAEAAARRAEAGTAEAVRLRREANAARNHATQEQARAVAAAQERVRLAEAVAASGSEAAQRALENAQRTAREERARLTAEHQSALQAAQATSASLTTQLQRAQRKLYDARARSRSSAEVQQAREELLIVERESANALRQQQARASALIQAAQQAQIEAIRRAQEEAAAGHRAEATRLRQEANAARRAAANAQRQLENARRPPPAPAPAPRPSPLPVPRPIPPPAPAPAPRPSPLPIPRPSPPPAPAPSRRREIIPAPASRVGFSSSQPGPLPDTYARNILKAKNNLNKLYVIFNRMQRNTSLNPNAKRNIQLALHKKSRSLIYGSRSPG
jgi:hypothetical protein